MSLRERDPQMAELADMLRANSVPFKVTHYRFRDGEEIGRIEPDPPHWVAIDILKPNCLLEATPAKGKK